MALRTVPYTREITLFKHVNIHPGIGRTVTSLRPDRRIHRVLEGRDGNS